MHTPSPTSSASIYASLRRAVVRHKRLCQGVLLASMLGGYALLASGCELLATDNPVQCDITGTVVGIDGGTPAKLDLAWVPDSQLASSFDILEADIQDNTFTITKLTVAENDSTVIGRLIVGEAPIPPMPQSYDPVEIPIDLPLGGCQADLGEIQLPLFGTGTPIDTNNNTTGTNSGTTSTNSGTTSTNNAATSTNNSTTSTNNSTTSTNNSTTATNNGTNNGTGG